MLTSLLAFICRAFHGRPMHPIQGQYRCRRCLRTFPVGWEVPIKARAVGPHGVVEA
jgi:hypothetical protein